VVVSATANTGAADVGIVAAAAAYLPLPFCPRLFCEEFVPHLNELVFLIPEFLPYGWFGKILDTSISFGAFFLDDIFMILNDFCSWDSNIFCSSF
jgi:hypothetical protein